MKSPSISCLAAGEEALLDLPGILAPLRILSVPAAARDLAVVENRHERTWTAVARVRFLGTANWRLGVMLTIMRTSR
jgi:hypothetical protein